MVNFLLEPTHPQTSIVHLRTTFFLFFVWQKQKIKDLGVFASRGSIYYVA